MASYLVRRTAQAVIVLIGVSIIAFVLQHLIAGGPKLAHAIIGAHATPATVNSFIHQYGLNRPLPLQYLAFLGQLVQGNLGYSFKINQSVDSIVSHDLPKDLLLVGLSIILAVLVAIPVGVLQAVNRNKPFDYIATAVSFGLYSMPSYWLGLLLIAGLSRALNIFPAEAPQATGIGGMLAHPAALVLPVLSLALVNYALFSRYVRASAVQQLAEDYIRTARAKGAPRRYIVTHHLLRNSVVPVVTLLGLALPGIITNGLVVELVFNFPGLGVTFLNSAQSLDYPVVLGITILICVFTVIGSLLADITYALLDPRVRYA